MKTERSGAILILFAAINFVSPADAHPGDGIVMRRDGTIYFTDVARETIWKLSPDGVLSELRQNSWTHGLFLASDGTLYYEREVQRGEAWPCSLWKMTPEGEHVRLIEPQLDRMKFAGAPFVIDSKGHVLFSHTPRGPKRGYILNRSPSGDVRVVAGKGSGELFGDGPVDKSTLRMVTSMTMGPDGVVYLTDRDRVRRLNRDGQVSTVSPKLLDERLSDPPQRFGPPTTINRLYGLTVSEDGHIYVAYHSGRRVLRIGPDRNVKEVYRTTRPWSPVGVVLHDGDLFVLEAGSKSRGPRITQVDLATGKSTTVVVVER